MGHEGVDTNWDLGPVSSTVSMLSHRGEFNKKQDKCVWYKNLLTWTGAHSAEDEYQNKITY